MIMDIINFVIDHNWHYVWFSLSAVLILILNLAVFGDIDISKADYFKAL